MGTAETLTTASEPLAGRELTVSCTETTGSPYSKSATWAAVHIASGECGHYNSVIVTRLFAMQDC